MRDERSTNPFAPSATRDESVDGKDRCYVRGFLHGGLGGFLLCVEIVGFFLYLLGW